MVQPQVPIKVFLVDDSTPIRQRVAEMLNAQAITVVGEGDSPQASIDGILATQPDVVVLDIQLHGGTGLDVLRAVRLQAPDIPFIVLSNNAGPAYRKLYRIEGAARFLDKSADFDQLAQVIKTVSRPSAASHPSA
jgi:DNA-binding NarL/FixJ family response regulator